MSAILKLTSKKKPALDGCQYFSFFSQRNFGHFRGWGPEMQGRAKQTKTVPSLSPNPKLQSSFGKLQLTVSYNSMHLLYVLGRKIQISHYSWFHVLKLFLRHFLYLGTFSTLIYLHCKTSKIQFERTPYINET